MIKHGLTLLLACALLALGCRPAEAQIQSAIAQPACAGSAYTAGQPYPLTQTLTGLLCGSFTGTITGPIIVIGNQSNAGAGTTGATNVPVMGYNYYWTGAAWAQWTGTVGLNAGSNLVGKFGIDQTTPGTTNGVQTLSGSVTAVTQATAANLNATVVGAGVAGTPAGGVVSIQGVTGGVAVPVSGTLSITANSAVNVAQVNGVTTLTGAGATGTGSQRNTVAQDTTTIAGSAPGTAGSASANVVSVQGIASGTNLNVNLAASGLSNLSTNIAQWGGTTAVTGGVNGSVGVGGQAANNAATAGYPLQVSALAESAEPTLATNGQNASLATDLAHKLIVSPYANKENMLRGSSAQTGTSAGTILAAGGSGLYTYMTGLQCSNTSATTAYVTLSDGAASIFIVPSGGGTNINFEVPLISSSTNTAITFTSSAGVSTMYCSAQGYKGS